MVKGIIRAATGIALLSGSLWAGTWSPGDITLDDFQMYTPAMKKIAYGTRDEAHGVIAEKISRLLKIDTDGDTRRAIALASRCSCYAIAGSGLHYRDNVDRLGKFEYWPKEEETYRDAQELWGQWQCLQPMIEVGAGIDMFLDTSTTSYDQWTHVVLYRNQGLMMSKVKRGVIVANNILKASANKNYRTLATNYLEARRVLILFCEILNGQHDNERYPDVDEHIRNAEAGKPTKY